MLNKKNPIGKKACLCASLFLLFGFNKISSQINLIKNGSFEDTLSCPTWQGQINNSKYWINPSGGTPDFFNQCDVSGQAGVPANPFGNQIPINGNAYAGFWCGGNGFVTNDNREYIQTKLSDSLAMGSNYCVSFNLSLSEASKYSVKNVGCFFSKFQPTDFSTNYTLNFTPQVISNIFVVSKINWVQLQFNYIPDSTYEWITIGNFFQNNQTDTLFVGGSGAAGCHFYIEDVSVVKITPAFAGNDTSICISDTLVLGATETFGAEYAWTKLSGAADIDSVNIAQPHIISDSAGLNVFAVQKTQCNVVTYDTVQVTVACVGIAENSKIQIKVYPNPASTEIRIDYFQYENGKFIFELFDILGNVVLRKTVNPEVKSVIDVRSINAGIYMYKISSAEKLIQSEKIIIK